MELFKIDPRYAANIPLYEKLLKEGANINTTKEQLPRPNTFERYRKKLGILTYVIRNLADIKVIKYLIRKGARIEPYYSMEAVMIVLKNQYYKYRSLPFEFNFMSAIEERVIDILKVLLQNGADINAKDPSTGKTIFMDVCTPKVAKFLLQNGANMYTRDNDGYNVFDYVDDNETMNYLKKVDAYMNMIVSKNRGKSKIPHELVKVTSEYLFGKKRRSKKMSKKRSKKRRSKKRSKRKSIKG